MTDHIVGLMWCKNEADILEETILDGLRHVDTVMIADDGSTDSSWEIIQRLAKKEPRIEYLQRKPSRDDAGQRQALLNEVRRRYRPETTLVQALEADLLILDTDIRSAWDQYCIEDLAMNWILLNGVRAKGTWREVDTYPSWTMPMKELLPLAHFAEVMTSTFRPLPHLNYTGVWRPWPSGFSHYTANEVQVRPRGPNAPLLLHVGLRGPTHFHRKYGPKFGKRHPKYLTWRVDSPENVERTVPLFNGTWNGKAFPATRRGWQEHSGF